MSTENKGYDLKIKLSNIQLCYDDIGEGGTPIIFLHGFPFDKTMWHKQFDFLNASYRLIAYDIRGFGQSKDEESLLSMDLFADDLIEFMDALDIEKAIICGLSMGGFIALNAINRFPNRFEALILCDTQCIADTEKVKEKRFKTIDEIIRDGPTKFNEKFIESVFHKDSLSNKRELVEQLSAVVFANSSNVIIHGLKALAKRSETCSTLSKISVPTLILCGREDEVTPLAQSQFMHESISGSELKVIENAGHVSNMEQVDDFNQHLLDFFMELDRFNFERINGSERMT